MSIITVLYYGNIDPQARSFSRDSHFAKAMELLSKNEELLTERLTGEEKQLFLDYVSAYSDVLGVSEEESFETGFRIGAQFIYDAFLGQTEQLKHL